MSQGVGKLDSFSEDAAPASPRRGLATMTDEPNKVDLASPDYAAEARARLTDLFPGVLQDGVLDATKLGELIGVDVTAPADGRESYGLVWAGKSQALRSLQTPSRAALVPDLERSVDWDNAQNVFIEGDNLEVLKLLQKAYNDKVKLIYIDPPYNTGTDFIYKDDFGDGLQAYLEYTGQIDEAGNRTSTQMDTAGRRHSKWLSMMYPRLVLARNMLTQDGGIFVSIDFNEVHNLRSMMDEIFGEGSFQREVIWRIGWLSGYKTMANNFIRNHDTMLFYSRNPDLLGFVKKYIANADFKPLVKLDKDMREKLEGFGLSKSQQVDLVEYINHGSRPDRYPIEDTWNSNEYDDLNSIAIVSFSGEKISKMLDVDEDYKGQKSVKMLQRVVESMTDGDDIVLDFFAGSGSTAHAVMQQNAQDGGRRKSISVNLQEPLAADSGSRSAGYETVCDIAVARIKKVMGSVPGSGDMGLRVLRLEESSFEGPGAGAELSLVATTLREGLEPSAATAAEILLKEGVPLDQPWIHHKVGNASVVVSGSVAVVLSLDVTKEVVGDALKIAPERGVIVFLEDGFAGRDAVKANAVTDANKLGVKLKTV